MKKINKWSFAVFSIAIIAWNTFGDTPEEKNVSTTASKN